MVEKSLFESISIGLDLGTVAVNLDEKTVQDRVNLVQWQAREVVNKLGFAPPATTIEIHPRMKFEKFPSLKAAIWAKSEHEFIRPMRVGSKVFVRGKVTDKYIKRGRQYVVTEFEAVDENGEVLLRSRETGINVE
ncbi:MAG TPA: MaoC family dehydratase [Dehalococcoidales bacterium]